MDKTLYSTSYIEKQKSFRNFVKEVQASLGSKEYQKMGVPIEEFVKTKWNISKAQAYRYVVCGKVLDQLKEFEIQPCHERLCRSLNNTTRTPAQMKLLWSTVIRRFRPENINSTNVIKVWKELYADERYYDICHYEDNIIKKVENSLNKLSNQMKNKHLKENKQVSSSISYTNSSPLSNNFIPNQSENTIVTVPSQYENNIISIPSQSRNINTFTIQYNNENCYNNYIPFNISNPLNENNSYKLFQGNNQYNLQFQPQVQQSNPQQQIQSQSQAQSIVYYKQNPNQIVYYY